MRKQIIKTATIKLEGDYEGWEFVARTNPPMKIFGEIASGEFARIFKGLAAILQSWNFVDEEGNELPPPSEETIGELPSDLLSLVSEKFTDELAKLSPNLKNR